MGKNPERFAPLSGAPLGKLELFTHDIPTLSGTLTDVI